VDWELQPQAASFSMPRASVEGDESFAHKLTEAVKKKVASPPKPRPQPRKTKGK
jgi:hypothetical protein